MEFFEGFYKIHMTSSVAYNPKKDICAGEKLNMYSNAG